MTYPASSDVAAGQPTAVTHYNNLRADALRFGADADDAVNIGAMFGRYQDNLNLVYLATNRVRVEASPTSPVALVINGHPLRTIANVDLAVGDTPGGAADVFYVFAIRSDDSSSFTLDVNTSPTEWTDARRIGSFYWDGTNIQTSSIRIDYRDYLEDMLSFINPQTAQGRLSLSTGVPVDGSDATGGTLYYTPYLGSTIHLYATGIGWNAYSFSEISLSFAGVAADKNFDIFAYYTGTAVALEALEWSNATTRATAIILQDGRYVLSGATDRLYLGTVRTSALSTLSDTLLKRFIFNYYNRHPRRMYFKDATASWLLNVTVIQQMNATAANKFEFLVGVNDTPVFAQHTLRVLINAANANPGIALGLDTIVAITGIKHTGYISLGQTADAYYNDFPGIGYHYLAAIDIAQAAMNTTFYAGDYHKTEGYINA